MDRLDQSVNTTGHPLQQRIHQLLRDKDWDAQHDGPKSVSSLAEMGVNYELTDGDVSDIDVRYSLKHDISHQAGRALYVIECKRAREDWIFFTREEEQEPTLITVGTDTIRNIDVRSDIDYPGLGVYHPREFPFVYEVLQVPDSGNVPRDERVWKGLTQASKGTIFSAMHEPVFKYLQVPGDKRQRIFYLPVLATTADLWITKHKHSAINLETGELGEKDMDRQEVEWVAFQHYLPREIRSRFSTDFLTVFIVKSTYLEQFIEHTWDKIKQSSTR